jgi:hypothetical protein
MNAKTLILSIVAVLMLACTGMSVMAVAYTADPYDGVNRIGTYYQYSNTIAYDYNQAYNYQAYDYAAPARAGGWFGSGTEWLVGLRSPVYAQVAPTHYTNYYLPTCGYPCYFGGNNGYPQATASQFTAYRTRLGGVFSY